MTSNLNSSITQEFSFLNKHPVILQADKWLPQVANLVWMRYYHFPLHKAKSNLLITRKENLLQADCLQDPANLFTLALYICTIHQLTFHTEREVLYSNSSNSFLLNFGHFGKINFSTSWRIHKHSKRNRAGPGLEPGTPALSLNYSEQVLSRTGLSSLYLPPSLGNEIPAFLSWWSCIPNLECWIIIKLNIKRIL